MGVQERKARQKENLRQEILDAARDLFVREGVENVSIRRIAERIEYSPGTIYLYFNDKAEILKTLCEETFSRLDQKLKAIKDDSTIRNQVHLKEKGQLKRCNLSLSWLFSLFIFNR